jgi:outer membrane murein-binding lipoprotein Lpp
MTCTKKALMVVMLTTLMGLWGCSQNGAPNAGSVRLRELEAKTARLEDDCKTAVAARDQARKKVNLLEEQRAQLVLQVEQLERVVKERDELKHALANRTAERDGLQSNLLQFGRDLQNLAAKIDQAGRSPVNPPAVTSPLSAAAAPE